MQALLAEYLPILIFLGIAIALSGIIVIASLIVTTAASGFGKGIALRVRL